MFPHEIQNHVEEMVPLPVSSVTDSPTRWGTIVSLGPVLGAVTWPNPHHMILIEWGKLTFDERVVLHRVVSTSPRNLTHPTKITP